MDKTISQMCQEIVAKTGWSQVRLSNEVGATQPTIHRIMYGQDDCQLKTYKSICRVHESVFFPKRRKPR